MKALFYLGGFYCLAFAFFHLSFWKLFDWKTELPKLNPINQGVMQILNLRLTYVLLFFAFVSFYFNTDLLTSSLGKTLLVAIGLFWLMRAVEQLIFWGLKSKISTSFFFIFVVGAMFYFGLLM